MFKIVVTGATGRLGANLVKYLATAGHHVTACLLPGDPQEPKLDGLPVDKHYADLLDADAIAAAVRGADAVVHTAAVMENVMDKMPPSKFFDINVKGTFHVLEATRRNGRHTRLVCLSSTSVYDVFTSPRTPIVESQPRRPLTLYGMNKMLIEEQVRQYGFQHDVKYTLLRPNYIVAGPEVLDVFTCRTVLDVLKGFAGQSKCQFHCPDDPDGWETARPFLEAHADELCIPHCPGDQSWRWHMSEVRDVVRLIDTCLHNDRAIGQTFNVAAADPCDWADLVPYLAQVTNRTAVDVKIPNLWQFSFDQSATKEQLGFVAQYDHRAIVDTAAAIRQGQNVGIIPGEIAPLAFEAR